jgi:hypothetical protein
MTEIRRGRQYENGPVDRQQIAEAAAISPLQALLEDGYHFSRIVDDYFLNRPQLLMAGARLPEQRGFAGPRVCHTTPGGVRVHVQPGCRCPKHRR